jgi:enoyl-CoA hydratase
MSTLVTYQPGPADSAAATITMDDGKVNALSPDMLAGLNAALDQAENDGKVVVLTGRPGIFSAGFDLRVRLPGAQGAAAMVRGGFELAARLLAFPQPVVIACPGHAIAMGSFLLLSADYRIGAAGPYKITANEVSIGMTMPLAAIEICRQRLAAAHLTRVIALAEVFAPDDAAAAGFLDRVVPAGELAGAAAEAAAGLAALDRAAHAATKLRLRADALAGIRTDLETSGAAIAG